MEILKGDSLWNLGPHLFVRDYLLSKNNSTTLKRALPPPPLSHTLKGGKREGRQKRRPDENPAAVKDLPTEALSSHGQGSKESALASIDEQEEGILFFSLGDGLFGLVNRVHGLTIDPQDDVPLMDAGQVGGAPGLYAGD